MPRTLILACFPLFIAVLLGACSRDNPLSIPDPLPPEPAPCVYPTPELNVLEDLGVEDYFEPVMFDPEQADYQFSFPFLQKSATINLSVFMVDMWPGTVNEWQNFVLDHPEIDNPVTFDRDDEIPELLSITLNNMAVEDNVTSQAFEYRLETGNQNTATYEFELTYLVPELDADCKVVREETNTPGSENETDAVKRQVTQLKTYTIELERAAQYDLTVSELPADVLGLETDDRFGGTISLSGDWLAVGVESDDSGYTGIASAAEVSGDVSATIGNSDAAGSGAVYMYRRGDSGWTFSHLVKAPNSEAEDRFGRAVGLYNLNFSNETITLMAVSAPKEDSSASGIMPWIDDNDDGQSDNPVIASALLNNSSVDSGAFYLYLFDGNEWRLTHYGKPPSNVPGANGFDDGFGDALTINADMLAISAPKEDSAAGSSTDASEPESGIVYIYDLLTSASPQVEVAVTYVNSVKPNVSRAGDNFGKSLALDDRFLAVGAPGEDSNHRGIIYGSVSRASLDSDDPRLDDSVPESGAAYVFQRIGNIWEQRNYIKAPNSDAGDAFGQSISINGSRLFIGAPREDSNGTQFGRNMNDNSVSNSGAVYGYSYNGSNWARYLYAKLPVQSPAARFGSKLAMNTETLLATAPYYDNTAMGVQGAYVLYDFQDLGGTYVESPAIWNNDPNYICNTGNSGSIPVECGERLSTLPFGWTGDSNLSTRTENFGAAIAIDDTTFVIAAPGAELTDGTLNAGIVTVHE